MQIRYTHFKNRTDDYAFVAEIPLFTANVLCTLCCWFLPGQGSPPNKEY